jgi:plasmid maintenance system antidote protein VapI
MSSAPRSSSQPASQSPPPLPRSSPALSSLLNSKAALSGDTALRIEKAFGVRMDTLMRMQSAYDIAKTRKRESHIHVARIAHLAA